MSPLGDEVEDNIGISTFTKLQNTSSAFKKKSVMSNDNERHSESDSDSYASEPDQTCLDSEDADYDIRWPELVDIFKGLTYGHGTGGGGQAIELENREVLLFALANYVIENCDRPWKLESLYEPKQKYGKNCRGKVGASGWFEIRDMMRQHLRITETETAAEEKKILRHYGDMMSMQMRGATQKFKPYMAAFLTWFMKIIYDRVPPNGNDIRRPFFDAINKNYMAEETCKSVLKAHPKPAWVSKRISEPQNVHLPTAMSRMLSGAIDIGPIEFLEEIKRAAEEAFDYGNHVKSMTNKMLSDADDKFGINNLLNAINAKTKHQAVIKDLKQRLQDYYEKIDKDEQKVKCDLEKQTKCLEEVHVAVSVTNWISIIREEYMPNTCQNKFMTEFVTKAILEKLGSEKIHTSEEHCYEAWMESTKSRLTETTEAHEEQGEDTQDTDDNMKPARKRRIRAETDTENDVKRNRRDSTKKTKTENLEKTSRIPSHDRKAQPVKTICPTKNGSRRAGTWLEETDSVNKIGVTTNDSNNKTPLSKMGPIKQPTSYSDSANQTSSEESAVDDDDNDLGSSLNEDLL